LTLIIDFRDFIEIFFKAATQLPARPFLHNSSIPAVLLIILIVTHNLSNNQSATLWLVTLITAFTTHHLRDANRRGLTFLPFGGNTRPIPDAGYIALILLTPFLLKYFYISNFKYTRLKTGSILDV